MAHPLLSTSHLGKTSKEILSTSFAMVQEENVTHLFIALHFAKEVSFVVRSLIEGKGKHHLN